jgi:hypothetical protein
MPSLEFAKPEAKAAAREPGAVPAGLTAASTDSAVTAPLAEGLNAGAVGDAASVGFV